MFDIFTSLGRFHLDVPRLPLLIIIPYVLIYYIRAHVLLEISSQVKKKKKKNAKTQGAGKLLTGSVPMHKNMRITASGQQDTLLISFLVNTRVGMTTNKAAEATLNGKYQHRRSASLTN